MKKLLTFVLVTIMLFTIIPIGEASAYRYQDSSVTFSVKQKTMYHSYNKIGSWWYGSKPF